MNFLRTDIPEVVVIEPTIHGDNRGYFVETFRQDKLEDFLGHKINFLQDNKSKSNKGVFRGLHYQLHPAAQTKLIRVIQGSVLDIAVDIREGSPIFELSDITCNVKPIETKEYPTPATRPHYSLLNKSKIKNHFDIEIPYWKDSVKMCLSVLKDNV